MLKKCVFFLKVPDHCLVIMLGDEEEAAAITMMELQIFLPLPDSDQLMVIDPDQVSFKSSGRGTFIDARVTQPFSLIFFLCLISF